MTNTDELRAEREEILGRVLGPSSWVDFADVQIELLRMLREAQVRRRGLPRKSTEYAMWKLHESKLRLIGDTLAWQVLDRHTIRNLAKSEAPTVALTENQGDLDFVISIARQIIDTGTFAIICDITRSLKVGDIVVRMPGGEIEVVECKNFRSKKSLTSVGGRVGRQIRRGKWLSEYLTRGIAVGTNAEALHLPKGMETEQMAVGVDVEEEYDWSLLTDAVGQAFATGFGAAANNHSFVFATRPGVTPPTDVVFPEPPDPGQSALLVSIGRDFFEMPAIHRPITLWELPLEHVLSIFEGDISLAHGVSVQEFCGACPDGSEWEIHSIDPSGSMHCRRSGGEDIVLTSNFVNRSRYEFQTVDSVRSQAFAFIRSIHDEGKPASESPKVGYSVLTPHDISTSSRDSESPSS